MTQTKAQGRTAIGCGQGNTGAEFGDGKKKVRNSFSFSLLKLRFVFVSYLFSLLPANKTRKHTHTYTQVGRQAGQTVKTRARQTRAAATALPDCCACCCCTLREYAGNACLPAFVLLAMLHWGNGGVQKSVRK